MGGTISRIDSNESILYAQLMNAIVHYHFWMFHYCYFIADRMCVLFGWFHLLVVGITHFMAAIGDT